MRRAAFLGVPLTLLVLGGCGFRPLYGSANEASTANLPDIFVQPIGDRSGQELRLALQQRLAGTSQAQPQGYTLAVSPGYAGQAIGINPDNSAQRNRVVASAHWVLSTVSAAPVVVAIGDARSVDGYNNINQQYFASQLANEATQQRVANNLADRITQQLAVWFSNHQAPSTVVNRPPGTQTLAPGGVPGDTDTSSPFTQPGPNGIPASATGRSSPDAR